MTRYRMLYNGDHWRVQQKNHWWPFWQWVGVLTFHTDTAARHCVEVLRHNEAIWRKRNAPYELSVYL